MISTWHWGKLCTIYTEMSIDDKKEVIRLFRSGEGNYYSQK